MSAFRAVNVTEELKTLSIKPDTCEIGSTDSNTVADDFLEVVSDKDKYQTGDDLLCEWKLRNRPGHYLAVYAYDMSENCFQHYLYFIQLSDTTNTEYYACPESMFSVFVSREQNVHLRLRKRNANPSMAVPYTPQFRVHYQVSRQDVRSRLSLVFSSNSTGAITPWPFGSTNVYPCHTNAVEELSVPYDHVAMVSFPYYQVSPTIPHNRCGNDYLTLSVVGPDGKRTRVMQTCYSSPIAARVYRAHSLLVNFKTVLCNVGYGSGFKMLFSFHHVSTAPREENGKFDCSGPDYASFKQHVHCNLESECQGGQDEGGHCPYSSPACNGSVATPSKCYRYFESNRALNWREAQAECKKMGAQLAMAKSQSEWEALLRLFEYGKRFWSAWLGLYTGISPPLSVYRFMLKWADNSMALGMNNSDPIKFTYGYLDSHCSVLTVGKKIRIDFERCTLVTLHYFICETSTSSDQMVSPILFPRPEVETSFENSNNQSLVVCGNGQLARSYLSCDPASACPRSQSQCPVFDDDSWVRDLSSLLYTCQDRRTVVPYTLLCDFRHDCPDGSDENFCRHIDQCSGFTCSNGQCVEADRQCDGDINCWDESDEHCKETETVQLTIPKTFVPLPPARLDYDLTGRPSWTPVPAGESCPDHHFRCPHGYCLPVYLRCNGVLDCPGREDEARCESFTCPGFYRCRASSVCVHVQHVCDGWPQCPQHDDELLCQATCPDGCSCQGLSFVCPQPFPAHSFPDVRYLDAAGSGMTPDKLSQNVYLVWLSLSSCRLRHLRTMVLKNLRTLDLSENELSSVSINQFLSLENLKVLRLSGNQLTTVVAGRSSAVRSQLTTMDLSQTALPSLDGAAFASYTSLQCLNVSFSTLKAITGVGLTYLPELVELDLRATPLQQFPVGLLTHLVHLSRVRADNYRLCCRDNLPGHMDPAQCLAPPDLLSSCHDLLSSDSWRGALWAMCVMAVTGNGGYLLFQALFFSAAKCPSHILLTNLSASNLLMGLYLAIVGGADLAYRGDYWAVHTTWSSGVACTVAGFLCALSTQVSAVTVCLLSLDRVLALRRLCLTKLATLVLCAIAWTVGVLITVTPLLMTLQRGKNWDSAVCVPLSLSGHKLPGAELAVGVTLLLTASFCLLAAFCQTFVLRASCCISLVAVETSMESVDLSMARRVAVIITYNTTTWIIVGMVHAAGLSGSYVPGVVRLIVAVWMFPLCSALSPFLYLLSVLRERQRSRYRERLMKRLAKRLMSNTTALVRPES